MAAAWKAGAFGHFATPSKGVYAAPGEVLPGRPDLVRTFYAAS